MIDTIRNINMTYPGVKNRKHKKRLKKLITYDALSLTPVNGNANRNLKFSTPKRGDLVVTASGRVGRFVGVDPTGKVWIAKEEYAVQFPYYQQCKIFDMAWR